MSRWTIPCSWACWSPSAAWWTKYEGMGHGHRALGFDQFRQVEPFHVFHGENDALAAAEGRIRLDDIGVHQPRRRADLAAEPLEHPFSFDQVLADDLEHLVTAHETIVGEIDNPHASAAKLADDLEVRMVGQIREGACHPDFSRPWSSRSGSAAGYPALGLPGCP